jgi:hypothetical protein
VCGVAQSSGEAFGVFAARPGLCVVDTELTHEAGERADAGFVDRHGWARGVPKCDGAKEDEPIGELVITGEDERFQTEALPGEGAGEQHRVEMRELCIMLGVEEELCLELERGVGEELDCSSGGASLEDCELKLLQPQGLGDRLSALEQGIHA